MLLPGICRCSTFNNILWAFLTIFQCTTETGWVFVMYAAQVGTFARRRGVLGAHTGRCQPLSSAAVCPCGPDHGPQPTQPPLRWPQDAVSPWAWLFFVAMILLCSYFVLNLALAVLYLQFTKEEVQVRRA